MTTREQAIQWWDNLNFQVKEELTDNLSYKQGKYRRTSQSLTGREIEEIWRKEVKRTENIYLNRLKNQYKQLKEKQSVDSFSFHKIRYDAMRLFCLDTKLVSFNDIEAMEYEVNQSF